MEANTQVSISEEKRLAQIAAARLGAIRTVGEKPTLTVDQIKKALDEVKAEEGMDKVNSGVLLGVFMTDFNHRYTQINPQAPLTAVNTPSGADSGAQA